MEIEQIKKMVAGPEYKFLGTNPHLKDRIVLVTLGGSYAYGTNVENSDVDIRGCALNSPSDLLGLTNFEQVVDTKTDTTIYAFNKLIPLLLNCNPNTIELLGCKPEHYLFLTDIGREMIENRKLFISQKAVRSFGGYAFQQLRRLENTLAQNRQSQKSKKNNEHLNKHAMHLIRLYLMCFDILEKGEVITYRGTDLDLLVDIRRGAYQNADGTYRDEFFQMVADFEKRFDYARKNTDIPSKPDIRKVEDFVMSVNRRSLDIND